MLEVRFGFYLHQSRPPILSQHVEIEQDKGGQLPCLKTGMLGQEPKILPFFPFDTSAEILKSFTKRDSPFSPGRKLVKYDQATPRFGIIILSLRFRLAGVLVSFVHLAEILYPVHLDSGVIKMIQIAP